MNRIFLALLGLGLVMPAWAGGELAWRPPAPAAGQASHGGHATKSSGWRLDGMGEGVQARMIAPDLSVHSLEARGVAFPMPRTGMDYYHALVASRAGEWRVETAIRYVPLGGRPSGHSPAEVVALPKARLEIVPDPLPREHWRYQGDQAARFALRFDGQPLAGRAMRLTSAKGSELVVQTDARGRAEIVVPDDLDPAAGQRQAGEMTLVAEHRDGQGVLHVTTLSAAYAPSPAHWKSLPLGAFMGVAGLVGGLAARPLLLRAAKTLPKRKTS
ncbi:MAG: hypothetical protein AB1340_01565 [Pseudomonadota bacterium]|jgi:hypothetical protein